KIGFNYVLIAKFELGVAGSAFGTAAAQLLSFSIILGFRFYGETSLRPSALLQFSWRQYWKEILALGAPQSLNFIGLALGSAAIIVALQWTNSPNYSDTVSAYGIITRVITFAFLPLLGLSFAMQTITGNNYGAALWYRSDASLRIALWTALIYCLGVQLVVMTCPTQIAGAFVDDRIVISEVGRILPIMTSVFFLMGPLMMLASHFQAIGSAKNAAILGLTKTYAFAIPLTFLLPLWLGEIGIWFAGPIAELMLLGLTIFLLWKLARSNHLKWGIFHPEMI
ncbi:MAG: MATE family efflux transporter, partial [Pseudomonadota bacterium]